MLGFLSIILHDIIALPRFTFVRRIVKDGNMKENMKTLISAAILDFRFSRYFLLET